MPKAKNNRGARKVKKNKPKRAQLAHSASKKLRDAGYWWERCDTAQADTNLNKSILKPRTISHKTLTSFDTK